MRRSWEVFWRRGCKELDLEGRGLAGGDHSRPMEGKDVSGNVPVQFGGSVPVEWKGDQKGQQSGGPWKPG